MIRRELITGIFRDRSPFNTTIHEQVQVDPFFYDSNSNPGIEVEDRHLSVYDLEMDSTYRGLNRRIVTLNNSGEFIAPEHIVYNPYLLRILSDINERLRIAGIEQPAHTPEVTEVLSLFEDERDLAHRIFDAFHPLIPTNEGMFRGTSPAHIVVEFSRPAAVQTRDSFLPETTSDWSINRALQNVLNFYRPDFQRRITWNNPPFSNYARRTPAHITLQPSFRDSLEALRTARQEKIIKPINEYISYSQMEEDESLFLSQAFNPENTRPTITRRTLNIPRLLQRFGRANRDIQIQPGITSTTPLPVSPRIMSQLHSYLTDQQARFTTGLASNFTDEHLTTPLSRAEFNFYRYSMFLRNLFRRSLLDLPLMISAIPNSRTDKRSLAFITTLKALLKGLDYPPFLEYEAEVLTLSRPLDQLIEDTAFYFSNYLLFHLELNQYTRLLKAIIQFSNLENKEDLSI